MNLKIPTNLLKCLESETVRCDLCGSDDWVNIKHSLTQACFRVETPDEVFSKATDSILNNTDIDGAIKSIDTRLATIAKEKGRIK